MAYGNRNIFLLYLFFSALEFSFLRVAYLERESFDQHPDMTEGVVDEENHYHISYRMGFHRMLMLLQKRSKTGHSQLRLSVAEQALGDNEFF